MNLPRKQKENHGHGERLVVAKGWGCRRKDWEFGVSRCKLLHLGWISNKVLP